MPESDSSIVKPVFAVPEVHLIRRKYAEFYDTFSKVVDSKEYLELEHIRKFCPVCEFHKIEHA